MPGLAALSVVVQFVNDWAPTVEVDTLTDSGLAKVSSDAPPGTFIAHISASDLDRGANGQVSCRLDSYHNDFRLVRMFEGEYKLITERSFDVVGVVVVTVLCQDHADPPLTTSKNISVTITPARNLNSPVFTQTVYNSTLSVAVRAPVFVIRVVAAAPSNGSINYSLAQSYPAFSIDRTTGVVRMVDSPAESTVELAVQATAAGGETSTAVTYVSLVRPEELEFKNRVVCSVTEDADPGTSVCSLADTDATLAADQCLYYDLVDATDSQFSIDPITGVIYTNRTLDREQTRHYRLTARVQLDLTPTRVVNVLLEVDVQDVNDCAPQFIFPSPGNDTVLVNTSIARSSSSQLLSVAVVSASDGDDTDNGRVTYSIIANNSDSEYFVVAPSTGEVSLNVADGLDELINRSFVLYIAATDQGRPPLSSVAVLHVVLPAAAPTSSTQSDSTMLVLYLVAGVLCGFVVFILVIAISILIVCRKSKRKKAKPAVNGDVFWGKVLNKAAEVNASTASSPATSDEPVTNHVDRPLHLSTLAVDPGVDYLQRYKVCIYRLYQYAVPSPTVIGRGHPVSRLNIRSSLQLLDCYEGGIHIYKCRKTSKIFANERP